jgi:hypothetical protein
MLADDKTIIKYECYIVKYRGENIISLFSIGYIIIWLVYPGFRGPE